MVVTLSNGVQLELHPVATFVLKKKRDEMAASRPQVPKVYSKDDDRWIEVPESPQYEDDLAAWQAELIEQTYNALIILGTKLLKVPDGFQRPEDTEWSEDLALAGIQVPEKGKARYLAWVKYWAAKAVADMTALFQALNNVVGVKEEDAAKMAAVFRGRA